METSTTIIPIWQSRPYGASRSFVRMIGSTLPLKPCPRACFQVLESLTSMRSGSAPIVPTLADVAWIASDEEETYARVRTDHRPLKHHWTPTPLLVMHRNSSVPNLRLDERKKENVKTAGLTALNRTSALQDELSRLRAQIARIVAADAASDSVTPELLSPDDCSLASFEAASFQPASFVISDITEESDEESQGVPLSFSGMCSSTFDFKPGLNDKVIAEEEDDDTLPLSKSSSFADMMDMLKDINKMKLNKDWSGRGCRSLQDEDSAVLISKALRKKFVLTDEETVLKTK
ncbi:mitochondrial fission regulator 1-like [Protopterus annectens]|uniref:mitochondrial fission regulator 1-like n=1 Tax=Protopterus annectens TaxID=7888 RepID=UPI001CFB392A|nr:mitochondrial fission regulator 1-like [Protopterus annectens]XP_043916050.1 mitochondrial fission regulator 1-like [Protopterus annectens]